MEATTAQMRSVRNNDLALCIVIAEVSGAGEQIECVVPIVRAAEAFRREDR